MGSQEVAAAPDLPRREPYGTLLGSSIVFAVIVLLVGTLVVVDNRLSGAEEIAPGTTLEVGNGVSDVPADLSVVVYAVSLPETAAQAGADVDGMLASIRANGGDR